MMNAVVQTEYEFTLPVGYIDADGTMHKRGTMRLATAGDEIFPNKDPRVQNNISYLPIIVLSRVITRLGHIEMMNTKIIEGLFVADLAYLQDFYNQINYPMQPAAKHSCPKCEHEFYLEVQKMGKV